MLELELSVVKEVVVMLLFCNSAFIIIAFVAGTSTLLADGTGTNDGSVTVAASFANAVVVLKSEYEFTFAVVAFASSTLSAGAAKV